MQLLLEMVRSRQADSPFAFQLGPQQYVLRTALGGAETARLDWDAELLDDLIALRSPNPSAERIQRMGARLRQFLMTTSFGQSEAAILDAVGRGEAVQVTLRFAASELFALPWELLMIGASGVQLGALPSLLLRYAWPQTQTAQPTSPTPASESGRILFAWSAAGGAVPAADQVVAVAQAAKRGQIPFDSQRDVISHLSPQRLVRALSGEVGQPPVAVLHILCHGAEQSGSFGLVWNDDEGDEIFVDAAQLRLLLAPYASTLRLVVLSSCDSGNSGALGSHLGSVAQALHRMGIATVLASRYPLSVASSLRLTQQLYDSLLHDLCSVEQAFVEVRKQLVQASSRLDWAALQLYARPEDGDDNRPILFRPYLGLAAFRMGQSRFLFGRDEERWAARQKLASLSSRGQPRFLVVTGASGTGKSSVVLGGLLPDLVQPSTNQPQQSALQKTAAELQRLLSSLPQKTQTQALRDALVQVAHELDNLPIGPSTGGWQWAVLRPGVSPLRSLDDALACRQETTKPFLLVVDQFEELFTQCTDEPQRSAFVRKLWDLAQCADDISVVVTLRVDFLGRCGELFLNDSGLALDRVAYADEHRVFVAKPTAEQLMQAIRGPAQLLGLSISPALVQRMLSDVVGEPGALPLLSYVLDLLWLRRDGRRLSETVYADLGGVAGALGQSADLLYASLDPTEQRLARQLLVRLVHVGSEIGGETRRRVRLSDLRHTLSDPQRLLDGVIARFVDARLLVRDEESGAAVIEFAHESLIRRWSLLRGFLLEDRQRLVELTELSQWVTQYRDYGTLLRGAQLGYAERLADKYPDELGEDAQNLVSSSLRAARRRRWLLTAMVIFVSVSLSALSLRAHRSELRAQAEKREAQSKTRTAQARLLGQHAKLTGFPSRTSAEGQGLVLIWSICLVCGIAGMPTGLRHTGRVVDGVFLQRHDLTESRDFRAQGY